MKWILLAALLLMMPITSSAAPIIYDFHSYTQSPTVPGHDVVGQITVTDDGLLTDFLMYRTDGLWWFSWSGALQGEFWSDIYYTFGPSLRLSDVDGRGYHLDALFSWTDYRGTHPLEIETWYLHIEDLALGEFPWLIWHSDGQLEAVHGAKITRRPTPVPEPSTLALFGLGLAAFAYKRRKT